MFENYPLDILYQDEYLVAINKPSGLLVHKSMLDKHEIYFAMKILSEQIGKWVYPVHRLDKPTSGVLLFALDKHSAKLISTQFADHTIEKQYINPEEPYLKEIKEFVNAVMSKDRSLYSNSLYDDYKVLQVLYECEDMSEGGK